MASPFVHRFTSAGHYFVYDVNTNGIFDVDKTFYDLIENIEWKSITSENATTYKPVMRNNSDLSSSGEFYTKADDVLPTIEDQYAQFGAFSAHRPRFVQFPILQDQLPRVYPSLVGHLILCVTEQCNLRCSYCSYSGTYQYNRAHNNMQMTQETAFRAIDFFIEHSGYILTCTQNPLYLGFYGGEPLLNHNLIAACIRHLDMVYPEHRSRVSLSVTTNLTAATPEMLRFLVDNKVKLHVSLDGPLQIQDRYRKTPSGTGSSELVLRNLERIRDYAPDFYKTEVSFNAVLAPPYDLPQVIDFFENNDFVRGHSLNFTYVVSEDTTFFQSFEPEYWKLCEAQLAGLRRRFVAQICSGKLIPGSPLDVLFGSRLRNVIDRPPLLLTDAIYPGSVCLPGCQRTFVGTTGELYMCEKMNNHLPIGSLSTGYDCERISALINQYEQFGKEDCATCWACRFCTNCFFTALHGDNLDRDRLFQSCASVRTNLAEALEDYAEINIKTSGNMPQLLHQREITAAELALRFLRSSESTS